MHIFVTVSQGKWRAFAVEDTNRSPTKRATDLLGSKVFWTQCTVCRMNSYKNRSKTVK